MGASRTLDTSSSEPRTQLIELDGGAGGVIRGLVDHGATPTAPVIVVVPAFGQRLNDYLFVAMSLTRLGLTVVRYDATNHVGVSDGTTRGFTLSGALTDAEMVIGHAQRRLGDGRVGLVSASLGARVAIRAAARNPIATVATVGQVVDVRSTVAAALGRDLFAEYLEHGSMPDDETREVLGHTVSARFVRDALGVGWEGMESVRDDLRSVDAYVLNVHGDRDPWVRTGDVLYAMGTYDKARVLVLRDVVHELNFVSAKTVLAHIAAFKGTQLLGLHLGPKDIEPPQFTDFVARSKREQRLMKDIKCGTI